MSWELRPSGPGIVALHDPSGVCRGTFDAELAPTVSTEPVEVTVRQGGGYQFLFWSAK